MLFCLNLWNDERFEDNKFLINKIIHMTPVFLFSLMVTVLVVGSLIVVLIEHIHRHEKIEEAELKKDESAAESGAHAEAGFDWQRAA